MCRSEIQLKSPNWLFGQRKYEESGPAKKVNMKENANEALQDELCSSGYDELTWLSYTGDMCEEDIFKR